MAAFPVLRELCDTNFSGNISRYNGNSDQAAGRCLWSTLGISANCTLTSCSYSWGWSWDTFVNKSITCRLFFCDVEILHKKTLIAFWFVYEMNQYACELHTQWSLVLKSSYIGPRGWWHDHCITSPSATIAWNMRDLLILIFLFFLYFFKTILNTKDSVPLFTKKTPSSWYKESHDKIETVVRPSQSYHGDSYTPTTMSFQWIEILHRCLSVSSNLQRCVWKSIYLK